MIKVSGERNVKSEDVPLVRCGLRTAALMRPVVVDLCCGMGGLSVAAQTLDMQVIGGVDLNAVALRTFSRNFPKAEVIEGCVGTKAVLDQCKLLFARVATGCPRIIVSGPPCQGFSVAGSRDPGDSRNRVLVDVAYTIAQIQPDCALIENVSTVLADKYGKQLRRLSEVLSRGNYHVLELLLDSSEFGVPQKRKRTFFFVTRSRLRRAQVETLLVRHKVVPVFVKEALHGLPTPLVRPDDYDDEVDYQAPANHFAMRHSESVRKKIAVIPPGKGPMSYRRLHPLRLANTLFSGHRAPPAHFSEPRSITVREAARLQGFPDSFRIYGSFGRQMEQVTNAVPPPLARAVLTVLLEAEGLNSEGITDQSARFAKGPHKERC